MSANKNSNGGHNMNYIKRLETENEILKKELDALTTGISDLASYLRSEKFQGIDNNWVNPQDVLLRLRETLNAANDVHFELPKK